MTNKNLYKNLGAKIRHLRNSKGLTISKLAELADMNEYYLGEIERAEKKASLDILSKLANVLDLELYMLLKFDNSG